ncbi:hypothetical protein BVX93_00825 [bacterium B13(2017)]|nr:hypothetical protein BVX93_00825 [bacterium B13(2017)]
MIKNTIKNIILLLFCVISISFSVFSYESVSTEVQLLKNRFYAKKVMKLIRSAKKNIRLSLNECEYFEDSKDISSRLLRELVLKAKRGVQVEVVLERGIGKELGKKNKNAKKYLFDNGIIVYDDADDKINRNNILIVDDFTVIVGSTVWTEESINKNDELVFWIESDEFAKVLTDRFDHLKIFGHR